MFQLKRILFPVDFSDRNRSAQGGSDQVVSV
jgi:hypothetical protein